MFVHLHVICRSEAREDCGRNGETNWGDPAENGGWKIEKHGRLSELFVPKNIFYTHNRGTSHWLCWNLTVIGTVGRRSTQCTQFPEALWISQWCNVCWWDYWFSSAFHVGACEEKKYENEMPRVVPWGQGEELRERIEALQDAQVAKSQESGKSFLLDIWLDDLIKSCCSLLLRFPLVHLNHLLQETYTSVSDQLEMSQISNEKLQVPSRKRRSKRSTNPVWSRKRLQLADLAKTLVTLISLSKSQ